MDKQKNTTGGVNINASDINIGNDIVGRDKNITNTINVFTEQNKPVSPRLAPRVDRPFVGREETLRDLLAALRLDEDSVKPPVILALKGMAGVGKTTLAKEIASQIQQTFPDGTLWIKLGHKPDVFAVLDYWGRELHQDFSRITSCEERSKRLHSFLYERKVLLIVDNVWSHEDAKLLLCGGPRCRMLITTRDEDVGAGVSSTSVKCLSQQASLELLYEIEPALMNKDEQNAIALVDLLGGLPLAIKLAASMIKTNRRVHVKLADILAELQNRDSLLKLSGIHDGTFSSLQAILGLSYDTLPNKACKHAFRSLGVFGSTSFSDEAVQALWKMKKKQTDAIMLHLINRALVESDAVNARYLLHAVLAKFAESKLEPSYTATTVRHAHAKYFLAVARKNVRNVETGWKIIERELGQIDRAFDFVMPKFRSKTRWALERVLNKLPLSPRLMAFDYYTAMNTFFDYRGFWSKKEKWTIELIKIAGFLGGLRTEGQFHLKLGTVYFNQGKWEEALKHYNSGAAIFEKLKDTAGKAAACLDIARIYAAKGEWQRALEDYQQSMTSFKQVGDRTGLVNALNNIGSIYADKGELDKALEYYLQCHIKDDEHHHLAAKIYLNIGVIHARKELWDKAIEFFGKSRQIFHKIGDKVELAATLANIGGVYFNQKEFTKALNKFNRARKIFEATDDQANLAHSLYNMARVFHLQGRSDKARDHYQRSLAIRKKLGERVKQAETLWKYSELCYEEREFGKALQLLIQADTIFAEVGSENYKQTHQQLAEWQQYISSLN